MAIYDRKAYFRLLVDSMNKSLAGKTKNLKNVEKGLLIASEFIKGQGVDCMMKKDFTLFLSTLDGQTALRANSQLVFGEVYERMGPAMWTKLPKELPPKILGLLEQRCGGRANETVLKPRDVSPASARVMQLSFKASPGKAKIKEQPLSSTIAPKASDSKLNSSINRFGFGAKNSLARSIVSDQEKKAFTPVKIGGGVRASEEKKTNEVFSPAAALDDGVELDHERRLALPSHGPCTTPGAF